MTPRINVDADHVIQLYLSGLSVDKIAKLLGAEAYGIAGGAEKCALLVERYGLAAAYDYRAGGLREKLAAIPGGIDVYFDNVGGPILEDVLANMALYGRVAVCGLVAEYTAGERRGPANFDQVLMKRLRIEGFFSPDFMDQGEVVEVGTPDQVFNAPKTDRLKLFLSQILRGH
jgi:NADPH-dependent curcumin reductase CurA